MHPMKWNGWYGGTEGSCREQRGEYWRVLEVNPHKVPPPLALLVGCSMTQNKTDKHTKVSNGQAISIFVCCSEFVLLFYFYTSELDVCERVCFRFRLRLQDSTQQCWSTPPRFHFPSRRFRPPLLRRCIKSLFL